MVWTNLSFLIMTIISYWQSTTKFLWIPPVVNRYYGQGVCSRFCWWTYGNILQRLSVWTFIFIHSVKEYIVCDICALRSPSFETTTVLCIIPINNASRKHWSCKITNKNYTPLCKSNGTFFSDMDINELNSVLHKYKTPVTECCILTCCWVNLVCIRHLIVKIMPEKHVRGPDFLMSDSLYIFQLFEN